jgi:hypothetical protein
MMESVSCSEISVIFALKYNLGAKRFEDVGRVIYVSWKRGQWWAVVNTVMNIRIP